MRELGSVSRSDPNICQQTWPKLAASLTPEGQQLSALSRPLKNAFALAKDDFNSVPRLLPASCHFSPRGLFVRSFRKGIVLFEQLCKIRMAMTQIPQENMHIDDVRDQFSVEEDVQLQG